MTPSNEMPGSGEMPVSKSDSVNKSREKSDPLFGWVAARWLGIDDDTAARVLAADTRPQP